MDHEDAVLFGLSSLQIKVAIFSIVLGNLAIQYSWVRSLLAGMIAVTLTFLVIFFRHVDAIMITTLVVIVVAIVVRSYMALLPIFTVAASVLQPEPKIYFGPPKPEAWQYDDGLRDPTWHGYKCDPDECHDPRTGFERLVAEIYKFLSGAMMSHGQIIGLVVVYLVSLGLICWVTAQIYIWLKNRKHRVRRGYQEILETISLDELVRERMAPGSEFTNAKLPKFQCEIWTSQDGGPFTYSGQGFRMGSKIWTAFHVVSDATEVKILNPSTDQSMVIPAEEFKCLEGDVAAAFIPKISALSLGAAKKFTGTELGHGAAFVEVHALGKKSIGLLTQHKAFGYATYSGSTISGFSGAPYVVNNIVCGMHIGHQGVNIGYDGAYLHMLQAKNEESSDDYLMDVIKKRGWKGMDVQQSPYDPDEYRIRYRGRYFNVDTDFLRQNGAYDQVYDEDPEDLMGGGPSYAYMGRRQRRRMQDYLGESAGTKIEESEVLCPRDYTFDDSGNVLPASAQQNVAAGANGLWSQTPVVVPTQVMQKQFPTPTLQFPSPLKNLVTALPASMHVQPAEALHGTPGLAELENEIQQLEGIILERRHRARVLRRQRKNALRSAALRLTPTKNGGLTSKEQQPTTSTTGLTKA